jgi:dolichyl-phosphate beta-glucosyltransferase
MNRAAAHEARAAAASTQDWSARAGAAQERACAIVVPCFNEAARLDREQLHELHAHGCALWLVDDGSHDATLPLLRDIETRAASESKAGVHVVALAHNRGKGEAVRAGLAAALASGAGIVGFLDADFATPPSEMMRVVRALQERPHVSVAIGARVALLGARIERDPKRHYLGRLFATAASLALGLRVYDTQCGAKAFRATPALAQALAQPFTSRWVFDVELLARLSAAGVREHEMIEVPLAAWRDVRGSKLGAPAMLQAAWDLARVATARRRTRRAGARP